MRRLSLLVFTLLFALSAHAGPKQAYELISFDYEELALWTDGVVRIEWNGTVESYLTYNGECRIVLKMVLESGEIHLFPTQPFAMQGLARLKLSDVFVVPREIWDGAVTVSVYTEDLSLADDDEGSESGIIARLKACLRETLADPELFEDLKSDAAYLRERVSQLEVKLMAASGLLGDTHTRDSAENREVELERFEKELEEVMSALQTNTEEHCQRELENE